MPCPSTNRPAGRDDERWRNYIRSVDIEVDRYWEPSSLRELVWILQRAEEEGRRVHPVGAGYSFEDLAATDDWMVDLFDRAGGSGRGRLDRLVPGLVSEDMASEALTDAWRERHLDRDERRKLVHVEAGARLFDLCRALDAHDPPLSLPTMGGAHGQHLAGAFSTSTHGSDVRLPPLCDFVRALHLVTVGGQEMWIESDTEPLTDDDEALRAALATREDEDDRACDDLRIVRDDDLLRAVVCAMGRFGVIYSVVYEVMTAFQLAEWVDEVRWENVRPLLLSGLDSGDPFGPLEGLLSAPPAGLVVPDGDRVPGYRYLDLAFNTRNNEVCWVRRRWEASVSGDLNVTATSDFLCHPGAANGILLAVANALRIYAHTVVFPIPFYGLGAGPVVMGRAQHLETMATLPHMTGGRALAACLNAIWASQVDIAPLGWLIDEITQTTVSGALYPHESKTEGRRGKNWVVSAGSADPASLGDCYRGNSIEVVFGLQSRAYVDFIDAMLGEARNRRQAGYMSVRFSRRSDALVSMHNVPHQLACSIEVTSLTGLAGNERWMHWLEETALRLGGRPHWGQQNRLNAAQVRALYGDRLLDWRAQLERVVGTSPTFSNDYTAQRGLEPAREVLAYAAWSHGHSMFVEFPERIAEEIPHGAYDRFAGEPGSDNWIHFAVPTPVIVDDRRLSLGSVLLRYRTADGALIHAVHVYDGEVRIAAHDDLDARSSGWELDRFSVPYEPEIYWGVGISVGVRFPGGGHIDLAASGADFIDWTA